MLTTLVLLLAASESFPRVGSLVYAANTDGDFDLYVADFNGKLSRKITDLEGDETWPRWSPDGERVLFLWEHEGRSDLAVVSALGGDLRVVTEGGLNREGAWSPDGEQIVFRSSRDGNDELYVRDLRTGEVRRLTDDPASDWGPDWGPDGWIVYATASEELEAIAKVPEDGGKRHILTTLDGEESLPRWSPNGLQIAFNGHPDGPSNELFVMDAKGGNLRRLTFDSRERRHASSFAPTWSPDGRDLSFTFMADGTLDLYRIRLDGQERVQVTNLPGAESRSDWRWDNPQTEVFLMARRRQGAKAEVRMWSTVRSEGDVVVVPTTGDTPRPALSPNGLWVAFESDRDGDVELYRMRADGTDVERLTRDPGGDVEPSWSPDGRRLVFSSDRAGTWDLWVLDLETRRVQRLTDDPGTERAPAWSPDGERIAYQGDPAGEADVYVLDAASRESVRITSAEGREDWPAWSPDGSELLYSSERDGISAIYVWNRESGEERRVTPPDRACFRGSWAPGGWLIHYLSESETSDDGDWGVWSVRRNGKYAQGATSVGGATILFAQRTTAAW